MNGHFKDINNTGVSAVFFDLDHVQYCLDGKRESPFVEKSFHISETVFNYWNRVHD